MVLFETGMLGFFGGAIIGFCAIIGVVAIAYVKKYKRLIDTMESINDVDNVEITVKKRVK